MEYNFREIEKKWQQQWNDANIYKVSNDSDKPKYYVLDMFPYPSGAGLHVGHPLGYIASDIYSRYKRLKGFNVLHPMGYDAFGLPAEQYAIEHGVHPADSTAQNIANFRRQLDNIGFCFDWSREVKTSDPGYYKWTQWIFLQLFHSWYNHQTDKAEPIDGLLKTFTTEGSANTPCPGDSNISFTANEWNSYDEKQQQDILMQYRLAYCGEGEVNWCEALGTVLANDEVVNGVSERGGYPVVKKKLRQWYLRITEYAGRLQGDLEKLEWTDAMKEMQTNWIGKSFGAEISFKIKSHAANSQATAPSISPNGGGTNEEASERAPSISPNRGGTNEEASGDFYEEKDAITKHHGSEASPVGGGLVGAGAEAQWEPDAEFYEDADPSSYHLLKEFVKTNRVNSTPAEAVLWENIKGKQLDDYKFRRQHIIGTYIADFVCLAKNLVIEVDGLIHQLPENKVLDEVRTDWLESRGYKVIRFTNEEVFEHLDDTLQTIKSTLAELPFAEKKSYGSQVSPVGGDLEGAEAGWGPAALTVYTTRPDTIMGVDFMVVAPELEWINDVTSAEQAKAVDEYIAYVASRSERERQAEKKITGCFTGAYAINPFNGREIPIWISEYVLAGYGTGAIMGVPCGDERDFRFAKHFNLPITNIIGEAFNGEDANATKDAVLSNSGFLDGTPMRKAAEIVMNQLEEKGIGRRKTNYRMRDAAFSRQRYWGEPFPIIWKDGIAYPLPESSLPLELPYMENIKPGSGGEGPLANNTAWSTASIPARDVELEGLEKGDKELGIRETNTMPGYAGSSWYFLRYMDPHNTETFADRKVTDYWNQVDVYVGGTEHAVGHLLYSRMWTKALYDLGHIGFDEPFKKLVNQGMITGTSQKINKLKTLLNEFDENGYSISGFFKRLPIVIDNIKSYFDLPVPTSEVFISSDAMSLFAEKIPFDDGSDIEGYFIDGYEIHVNIEATNNNVLDYNEFQKKYRTESIPAFVTNGGIYQNGSWVPFNNKGIDRFKTRPEVEKMSKSKLNVVNPDDLVQKYGADTFRMYEMFLGPIEQSKPWDTKGIEGVHRFLKKLWRLFFDELKGKVWTEDAPTAAELKVLHRTIKKLEDDTDRFSFNTGVSAFMVCVNELTELKCSKKAILEPLVIMLSSYAPHISEELYQHLQSNHATVLSSPVGEVEGAAGWASVLDATYPIFEEKYVAESSKEYPVSINGKLRTTMTFPLDAEQSAVEPEVLDNDIVQKWMEGKPLKKMIYVKGKMINVVV